MGSLRTVLAPNASPLTLDGTRTFLVGREEVAIIDPGPDLPEHVAALTAALRGARAAAILLTHRHPDHAGAAPALARALAPDMPITFGPAVPSEGQRIPTDAGELVALATPGHSPEHCAIHWPAESAIFCGDLMMGGMDTALVAAPDGNLADYLESLDRLERLAPQTLYPTHGPVFTNAAETFGRYRTHRAGRLRAVQRALEAGKRSPAEVAAEVYGAVTDPELGAWLEATTLAYLEYLGGSAAEAGGGWHDE
jgi:hydroxyacylglutathione hydrolase